MRLKSYFCATVEAAMEMARKELGEDALLVNARPATAATRSLGALEVVFGLPAANASTNTSAAISPASFVPRVPLLPPVPSNATGAGKASPPAFARPDQRISLGESSLAGPNRTGRDLSTRHLAVDEGDRHNGVTGRDVLQDMAALRREMERISQSLRAAAGGGPAPDPSPPGQQPELYRRLLEAELTPTLARQVADGAALVDFVDVDATLGYKGCGTREPDESGVPAAGSTIAGSHFATSQSARHFPVVVALVGPPGAGKTTTLIKLAARYGLAARRSTHIISADVERIAAADQLRVLSAILGTGCTVVETARSLAQAIEEHRHKDFIFIDTPGFAADEMGQAAELAAFLAGNCSIASHIDGGQIDDSHIDTHLVLPASMRGVDLARMTGLYGVFRPAKLLFTKMDETRHFGALVSESARCGLPLSFLSMGQTIPDHLEPASKEILAALILGEQTALGPERISGRRPAPRQMGAYEHRAAPKRTHAYEPVARKLAASDLPQATELPQGMELPQAPVEQTADRPRDKYAGNAPAKARAAGAGA